MRTRDWKSREGYIRNVGLRLNELLAEQTSLNPHIGDDHGLCSTIRYRWDVFGRAGVRNKQVAPPG